MGLCLRLVYRQRWGRACVRALWFYAWLFFPRHDGACEGLSGGGANQYVGAVLGLVAGVYIVSIGFQKTIGVSFPTGYAFYPDLTATTVAAMALALLLAAGRLALVIRGG